jgi:hypothetical protein
MSARSDQQAASSPFSVCVSAIPAPAAIVLVAITGLLMLLLLLSLPPFAVTGTLYITSLKIYCYHELLPNLRLPVVKHEV